MRPGMSADRAAIAVFGATGYTGRLVAAELHRHGAPLLLAGRDRARLAAQARALAGAEVLVARVDEPRSLDALAARARVIVNCVGPFIDLGEPVVRAAIAGGAHYLDTTGEQPFVQAIQVHDTWARAQGVAVVPALAFEIALADCAAALAARGLDAVDEVRITYATRLHASQGTKRSALRMLQEGGCAFVDGAWVAEPPGAHLAHVDVPPLGRVAALSFPGAEVISVPRHVAARTVRTYMSLPGLAARALSAGAGLLPALARSPLGAVAAGWLGSGTEGPDAPTRQRDEFHLAVDALGRSGGLAASRRLVLHGRDPYGLTAAIARQGALWLAAGEARAHGVLAPAMAFDPRRLLAGLAAGGVTVE